VAGGSVVILMAKILIVDDEPDLSAAFGRYFERTGHDVLRAGTGEEAIAMVEAEHPALMLLDLKLPDMTGFDVLARTREHRPVVVVVTGHADVALAVEAMQAGAEGFLTKPVELAHLGAVVDRALEKAQLRDLSRAGHCGRGNLCRNLLVPSLFIGYGRADRSFGFAGLFVDFTGPCVYRVARTKVTLLVGVPHITII